MVKLLIVEDSPVQREFLAHLFSSDPDIQIVAAASSGEEAIELVKKKKPDVIAMDVHMPGIDGLAATREIMETFPTPIVVISGSSDTDKVNTAFRAMEAGALAVVPKPKGIGDPENKAASRELLQTIKLMSEVKVVRRWKGRATKQPEAAPWDAGRNSEEIHLVAIGASTGGPVAIQTILSQLPNDFPAPILIVQHITSGFLKGFVEWLGDSTPLPIHVAVNGENILPGHVYVAPEDYQMEVRFDGKILLTKNPPENGHRPSVSPLFRSVANVYGKSGLGVLLTGMGRDGAEELKLLREKGGITIAQDKESSVIFGMPGEAIKLDGATYVLSAENISSCLAALAKKNRGGQ